MFGKKKPKGPQTIQEAQSQFNHLMYRIGSVFYQKHMKKQELTQIDSMLNELTQSADKLGKEAQSLQAKAQQEVAKKVEEGQARTGDGNVEAAD